jgi:hypothetical protein
MAVEYEHRRIHKENLYRALGITYRRHFASYRLSRLAGHLAERGYGASKEQFRIETKVFEREGVLSKDEIAACEYPGLLLPAPFIPGHMPFKYIDPARWQVRIGSIITDEKKRVYVVGGVYDLFTGGQSMLIAFAKSLTLMSRLPSFEILKHMEAAKIGVVDDAEKGNRIFGSVFAYVESDDYVKQIKGREPIFPQESRAGWFDGLPVGAVTVYPSSIEGSQSWDYGLKYLDSGSGNWPPNLVLSEWLNFVIPAPDERMPKREIELLETRKAQLLERGIGVIQYPSRVLDISTTSLIEQYDLEPVYY